MTSFEFFDFVLRWETLQNTACTDLSADLGKSDRSIDDITILLSASLSPPLHSVTQDFNGYRRRRLRGNPIIPLMERLGMLKHMSSGAVISKPGIRDH